MAAHQPSSVGLWTTNAKVFWLGLGVAVSNARSFIILRLLRIGRTSLVIGQICLRRKSRLNEKGWDSIDMGSWEVRETRLS